MNQHQAIGINFQKEARRLAKKNKNLPNTHSNIKEPNKTVSFKMDQVYSPQAKNPSSLTKKKKKKKKKMASTKTFLRKRLGEERFKEIMKLISEDKQFSFGGINEILTPAEEDLGMFIVSVLKNDTPKTDSSFREGSKGRSRFSGD